MQNGVSGRGSTTITITDILPRVYSLTWMHRAGQKMNSNVVRDGLPYIRLPNRNKHANKSSGSDAKLSVNLEKATDRTETTLPISANIRESHSYSSNLNLFRQIRDHRLTHRWFHAYFNNQYWSYIENWCSSNVFKSIGWCLSKWWCKTQWVI